MKAVEEILKYAKNGQKKLNPYGYLKKILADVYHVLPGQVTDNHIHTLLLELTFQVIILSNNPGVRFIQFGFDVDKSENVLRTCLEHIKYLEGSSLNEGLFKISLQDPILVEGGTS